MFHELGKGKGSLGSTKEWVSAVKLIRSTPNLPFSPLGKIPERSERELAYFLRKAGIYLKEMTKVIEPNAKKIEMRSKMDTRHSQVGKKMLILTNCCNA